MELTAEWTIAVGGKWPLEFKFKEDDLPTGVIIVSVTKTVSPAAGLTVADPSVNVAADGFISWAEAATAGGYSLLFVATRSDGGKNVVLGHVEVAAASDRTTLAANALITLADFRGYMGDESINKNVAEAIINGVSQEFDRFVGRVLKQATSTALYLDGNGERDLDLPNWPAALGAGTVTEDGTLLTESLTGDFVLYTSDDCAYLRKIAGHWIEGPKTVLISTIALGYATIPGDIVLKALRQCAFEFQSSQLKTWGETSRSVEGGSVSMVEPGLLPDVQEVLTRYRRFGL